MYLYIKFTADRGEPCPYGLYEIFQCHISQKMSYFSDNPTAEQATALPCWILNSHSQATTFSLFLSDIPHFVRRDIFAFAKVILRLSRSDILFAINVCKANITRLKAVYHCEAIELAVRQIELKKALAIASAFFSSIRLAASSIASQWYTAFSRVILPCGSWRSE